MNGMNNVLALDEIKSGLDQIRGASTLRQQIAMSLSQLPPEQLLELVLGGNLAGVSIALPTPVTAPQASNVVRSASGRRAFQIVDGRPSLPWGMRVILKEAGHAMHTDDIYNALVAYGWIPKKTKDPRQRMSHVLSSQKSIFLRAGKKFGRGFYVLASAADVQDLPSSVKRARSAPALTRPIGSTASSEPVAAPAKKASKVKAAPEKKPTHKPLAERKETMGPALKFLLAHKGAKLIAATDVAKAIKAEPNEMQGPLIAMLRSGAWSATKKENDEGKTLYKVNPDKLAAHVKRFEEKTGKKLVAVKAAPKAAPKKKASKKVAKKAAAAAAAPKKVAAKANKPGVKKASAKKPAAKTEAAPAAAAPAATA